MAQGSDVHARRGPGWRALIAFLVFAGIAALLLTEEHRAHTLGLLPFLVLALCPLMHLFMHHGHGGHGSGPAAPAEPQTPGERGPAGRHIH